MAEYVLKGGVVLTDEDFERMSEACERGEYPGFGGGEVVHALVAFTDGGGCMVEGTVCAIGEDGRTVSVEDGDGNVHEGIPCSDLRVVQSVWERMGGVIPFR